MSGQVNRTAALSEREVLPLTLMDVTHEPQNGPGAQAWGAIPPPTPQPRAVVCPYCGHVSTNTTRCSRCSGRFDPLSRQATQNAMGPWSFIDPTVPNRAGCSYETLIGLIQRGTVRRDSIVRGPTTRQFWMLAARVPGVGHHFGACHNCLAPASADAYSCSACGAVFEVDRDRQHLGVGPVRPLAGQASPERIAAEYAESLLAPARSQGLPQGPASPDRGVATARSRIDRRAAQRQRQQWVTVALIAAGVIGLALVFVAGRLPRGAGSAPAPSSPAP